jgi:hypothetical protein
MTEVHDHDLLIEIKTMLTMALEQQRQHGVQLTDLSAHAARNSERIVALESASAEKSRLPNWVPTVVMICSVLGAALTVYLTSTGK